MGDVEKFADMSEQDIINLAQVKDFYRIVNGKRVLVKGFQRKTRGAQDVQDQGSGSNKAGKPKFEGKPLAGMTALDRYKEIQKSLQGIYSGKFRRDLAAKGASSGEMAARLRAQKIASDPTMSYEDKRLAEIGVSEAKNKAYDKAEGKVLKQADQDAALIRRDSNIVNVYLRSPDLLNRMKDKLGDKELARLEGIVAGRLNSGSGGPNSDANNALQGLLGQIRGYRKRPGNY